MQLNFIPTTETDVVKETEDCTTSDSSSIESETEETITKESKRHAGQSSACKEGNKLTESEDATSDAFDTLLKCLQESEETGQVESVRKI